MKASLAYTTAEGMAQWKWILLTREPQLLIDYDRIDAATRGPLLRILLRTRGALVVQCGAMLSLLAIGLDPLAQLVQLRSIVPSTTVLSALTDTMYLHGRVPTQKPINFSSDTEQNVAVQSAGLADEHWGRV